MVAIIDLHILLRLRSFKFPAASLFFADRLHISFCFWLSCCSLIACCQSWYSSLSDHLVGTWQQQIGGTPVYCYCYYYHYYCCYYHYYYYYHHCCCHC